MHACVPSVPDTLLASLCRSLDKVPRHIGDSRAFLLLLLACVTAGWRPAGCGPLLACVRVFVLGWDGMEVARAWESLAERDEVVGWETW